MTEFENGNNGKRGRVGFFSPPSPAPTISSPDEVQKAYRYWRFRIMATTMIGYALYYFVRKNISLALPAMEADLGISKADLGLFLTLHGVLYGISKFFNGFIGDRSNPRTFMAVGLLLSAGMNICFGMSSGLWAFGIFWMLNGWAQGMGFPPCARSITHWFSPGERPIKFSIWNTSHSIGAAIIAALAGYLATYDWRLCFFIPAGIAIVGTVFILISLRDTPASLGLPPVEEYMGEVEAPSDASETSAEPEFKLLVMQRIFMNPLMWVLAFANFFVYVVRYALFDWGPSYLHEARGLELSQAGWVMASFEISGIFGMLVGGVVTEKVFRGHAGRASVVYMALCSLFIFLFWKLDTSSTFVSSLLLCGTGFFIYGPQCLVGVIAANLSTKRAAATAIGLTGLFGYLSTIFSGWGLGVIVDNSGWNYGFRLVVISAGIATVLFLFLWKVGPHTELATSQSKE